MPRQWLRHVRAGFAVMVSAWTLAVVANHSVRADDTDTDTAAAATEMAARDAAAREATEMAVRTAWQREMDEAIEYVDHDRARRLARRAILRWPEWAAGWAGLGRYHAQRHEWADAESAFDRALAHDPHDYFATLGMGLVAESKGDFPTAQRLIERARTIDPHRDSAAVALGRVRFKANDIDSAVELYWHASDLNRIQIAPHLYLGNGFVSRQQPVDVPGIERMGHPLARAAYRAARRAYIANRIDDADEQARVALQADAAYFGGPFILGLVAHRRADLDGAIAWLSHASDVGRGHPLVHNALGVVLAERKVLRYAANSWPEVHALREAIPTDIEVPRIDNLIRNFAGLPAAVQNACKIAAAPFAHYLPTLAAEHVKHDIITLAESAIESPQRQWLRGRRTMDGRLYNDVRGMGGKAAVTSIEDVESAVAFMFNTFAHELAHQIHRVAFSPEQVAELDRLYAQAMRDKLTLDFYAAHNVDEYFAQGYEAFVSLFKLPGLGETARHTRFELAAKDPALFAFIESATDDAVFDDPRWDLAIETAERCLRRSQRTAEAAAAAEWVAARRAIRESAAEPR